MSEPDQLGNYKILGKLGRGSFGTVYRGHDPGLGREVAIKVCSVADQALRQRFTREAEISGRLQHANIVGVYAFAEHDGIPFLVQEMLAGEDLRSIVKRREAWSLERRLDTLLQIAEGLAYAHGQGVVHRDVKPANIRILPDGRVKIMDFGIAKLANDESQLTQKGVTMGTASYLPPEQVRGGDVDQRADLFSFGVLAYELLTFERPFHGKTISALVYQILYKAPRPLDETWPACPPELAELVGRCLEKDADDRFSDMDALLDVLRAVRTGVEEGRWPGLLAPTPPPPLPRADEEPGSSASHAFVSESQMVRAVTSVDEEGTPGDTAATQRIDPSELPTMARVRPSSDGDAAATQRIDASELPTMVEAARSGDAATSLDDGAKTRRIAASELPTMVQAATSVEPSGDEAVDDADDDALATSAHEISKLVTEGKLEAAMEQLEETMATVSGSARVIDPPADPAAPPPTPMTALPIDAEAPTRPLSRDVLEAARAKAPPTVAPAEPNAAPPPPSPPPLPSASGAAAPAAKSAPAAKATRSAPTPPQPSAAPAGARGASSSGPPKMTWIAGGIAALLIATVLLFVFFGGDDPEPVVEPPPVVTPEPTPPPPPALPERGVLLVASTPWTRVVEIARYEATDLDERTDVPAAADPDAEPPIDDADADADADADSAVAEDAASQDSTADGPVEGDLDQAPPEIAEILPLPGGAATPLRLDLPPGRYRVTLEAPAGVADGSIPAEDLICEVTVTLGAEVLCRRTLGAPSALDLFKDNGWWS
ncbi:MAG: serine/threonine-protein kinase [Acidobacteriota bacterium]